MQPLYPNLLELGRAVFVKKKKKTLVQSHQAIDFLMGFYTANSWSVLVYVCVMGPLIRFRDYSTRHLASPASGLNTENPFLHNLITLGYNVSCMWYRLHADCKSVMVVLAVTSPQPNTHVCGTLHYSAPDQWCHY